MENVVDDITTVFDNITTVVRINTKNDAGTIYLLSLLFFVISGLVIADSTVNIQT